ncbi:hypothetical protein F4604DRAFT_1958931 [Suillus subluteus]|nr:hypothetical protein F4604DRAFT_1958931 [Suillus subluteus]
MSNINNIALRKRKNADGQAAFRQRRANYIATLEETVTGLESLILQLQDSCHEARSEAGDLRQESARLIHELHEREKFWGLLWLARKTGQAPESDDLPPLPSSFAFHPRPQQATINHRTPLSHGHNSDDSIRYQTSDETFNSLRSSSYISGPGHSYATQSPALSYTGMETGQITSGGAGHDMNARVSKYGSNLYLMQPINRDGPWTHNVVQTASANGSLTLRSTDVYANRHFEERRANSGRSLLPSVPQFSGSENSSHHEWGISEGKSTPYSTLRPRRGRSRESRSPSPGGSPISSTLVIIKSHAFGAYRRTCTRTKKTSEGAPNVAMEVLKARGIGMGVVAGSKRPHLHHDDSNM